MKSRKKLFIWLLLLVWALFINACNVWIIRPLVADFSLLGVLAVAVIAVAWLTSIPARYRRLWIGFTIFSLLLGDGLSSVMSKPLGIRIALAAAMCIGLCVVGWLFTRWRLRYFIGAAVVLLLGNVWLPVSDWPFLTHFGVAYRDRLPMDTSDLPALPMELITTKDGNAIITLENVSETQQQVQEVAEQTGKLPNALEDYLRNYQHRYQFIKIAYKNGHFVKENPDTEDLAAVNPLAFTSTFFPFMQAHWTVENNHVIQYMSPSEGTTVVASITNQAAILPSSITAVADITSRQESAVWAQLLKGLGTSASSQTLQVEDGVLRGTADGKTVSVPVKGFALVGTGSFTAVNVHEALLQGPNTLEIVSLDSGQVVATFHGDVQHPVPSDLVVGAVDNSGRNVIFVNASPAFILQANTGAWQTLYTAPQGSSLRFEASARFGKGVVPEIITNDPSLVRSSPVRYLSSYVFRDGQLERNWRVFQTNVVNVHTVSFSPGGAQYLVANIYGSGEVFVLKRHGIPVVPITGALLGLSIVGGWIVRGRRKGDSTHA